MPLIDPGPDPTWSEIEAGLEANGDEDRATKIRLRQAVTQKRAAEQSERTERDNLRLVDSNYEAWIAAIRRRIQQP